MLRKLTLPIVAAMTITMAMAPALFAQDEEETNTVNVVLQTNLGDITLELYTDKAPETVKNFVTYVNLGFYDGTVFHRVINGFMIQGGGYTQDLQRKETREPIKNESDNGLSNKEGTIAMARLPQPDTATAQFFINVADNSRLDYSARDGNVRWGYAVFGRVTDGMDVVNEIKAVDTGAQGPLRSDVPLAAVVIESARVVEPEASEE